MKDYDNELSMLTRVAWMYYVQGMTHEEIAEKIHYSRSKVTRMLARAREQGIVEINVRGAYRSCIEVGDRLKEQTGLSEIIVVPSGDDLEGSQRSVGRAAADYINASLRDGEVLGLAWGISFQKIIPYLKPHTGMNITTVQLMGGVTTGDTVDPQRIVSTITSRLGARGVLKSLPVVVDSGEIKAAMMRDRGVQEIMSGVKNCTKALFGVGTTTTDAALCLTGAVTEREMAEIRAAGAVGDVTGWYLDRNGKVLDIPLHERLMSPPPEMLRSIPVKIIETAGLRKADALTGAIRGGWVDVLIIDEELAAALCERF